MRRHLLALRQLYVEQPQAHGPDDFRSMFPVCGPVFVPGDHRLPELPLTEKAPGLKGKSEAGDGPAPDVSYRQLAGSASRSSFFGSSAPVFGLDCRT